MKIKEILVEYMPIMEMYDTRFDQLSWMDTPTQSVGTGIVNRIDTKVQVTIAPITINNINGLNITFAVWTGAEYTELFQDKNVKEAAAIIGAVVNAFKEKIDDFDWSFVCLIAKDNIDARARIYTNIAERLRRELKLNWSEHHARGSHITLMTNPTKITPADIQGIIKVLN